MKKHQIKAESAIKRLWIIFFITSLIIILLVMFLIVTSHLLVTANFKLKPAENISMQSKEVGQEIILGNTAKKEVIFTFDGGSEDQSATDILAVLAKHHVKGTFFLTGKMMETYPDLVKRIAGQGCEIFNHTYDHPHLTALSDGEIQNQLIKMQNVLETIAHISPKPFFREPYGDRDARVLNAAAEVGYRAVNWTVDALDWKESLGETAGEVEERIISNVAPGTIYLMHLGDKITGSVLDDVFTKIEQKGYKIVSLTQGI